MSDSYVRAEAEPILNLQLIRAILRTTLGASEEVPESDDVVLVERLVKRL